MSERKVGGIISDEKTAEAQTKAAMDELMGISSETHKFIYEKMLVEKDGKLIEIEVPIDDIDLVSDFDDEDLTEEGYRSLGMIDKDYDSTSEGGYQLKSRKKLPVVVIEVDENDMDQELEIKCPYTGSTNLYQIDAELWASYESDQPFVVILKSKNED